MLISILARFTFWVFVGMAACILAASGAGRVLASGILSFYTPPANDPFLDIFVFDTRTRILHNLTRNTANEALYAWSPDGTQLAFISTRETGVQGLYVSAANGSQTRRIETGYIPFQPSWSPDGTQLALAGIFGAGQPDVLAVNVADATTLNLTRTTTIREVVALWSPDGRYIAYLTEENPFVYVVAPDGSADKLVTLVYSDMPVWSPDGKWLAYVALGDSSVQLQAVDDATRRTVYTGSKPITTPVWSPDGTWLAFVVAHTNQHFLRLINVEQNAPEGINSFWTIDSPAWSPDGRTLAFFGSPLDNPQERGIYLYDMASKSTQLILTQKRLSGLDWQP